MFCLSWFLILEICNLVSVLFLAETNYNFELLIEEFVKLFAHETDKQAVSLLVNWFRQLAVYGRVRPEDYQALEQEYHSAQEVRTMLIEALAKEKQQIREEGREEGGEEGALTATRRMLEQILQGRFGDLPTTVSALLRQCSLVQLNELINTALDAPMLAVFLRQLQDIAAQTHH